MTYGLGARPTFARATSRSISAAPSTSSTRRTSFLVRLPLIGRFNVYNSLAAIAAASRSASTCAGGAEPRHAPHVPGRLEAVPAQRQFQRLRRLRAHRRCADQRDEDAARTVAEPAHRRLWLRRQSRPRQAPVWGRRRARRLRDCHLGQSAQGRTRRRSSPTSKGVSRQHYETSWTGRKRSSTRSPCASRATSS